MTTHVLSSKNYSPDPELVAIHLIREMTTNQRLGRPNRLRELATKIGVRHADAWRVLCALHRQGFVDGERLRLTLAGFALGAALTSRRLAPLRPLAKTHRRAA